MQNSQIIEHTHRLLPQSCGFYAFFQKLQWHIADLWFVISPLGTVWHCWWLSTHKWWAWCHWLWPQPFLLICRVSCLPALFVNSSALCPFSYFLSTLFHLAHSGFITSSFPRTPHVLCVLVACFPCSGISHLYVNHSMLNPALWRESWCWQESWSEQTPVCPPYSHRWVHPKEKWK